ncbi:myomesin-3-like isoform X2 [Oncorhynchus mykiss]|uniref:myomesin-3-like isoform X2 n=1 Tax=Oncorhynchus mykiss TaxID=8022 RepID=UPI00187885FA|nr:myomesin-3-like isoform X2 [Oncorhynchus mykiss]XP_036803363.1 myomesin-3-like isoform X2 [Oncorhynchus mykiss]
MTTDKDFVNKPIPISPILEPLPSHTVRYAACVCVHMYVHTCACVCPLSLSLSASKINFDKASGLIEILFDQLSKEDEGSYTARLCDGHAKNQFALVLVDESESIWSPQITAGMFILPNRAELNQAVMSWPIFASSVAAGSEFCQTLAQSRANRMDYKRKSGPYFLELLSWTVTEDSEFITKCKVQVTNVSKDTTLKWFKDGVETPAVYDQQTGVRTMTVQQVTKEEAGHYKAVASDGGGQDVSTLELLHEEYDKLLQLLSKQWDGGLSGQDDDDELQSSTET